MTRMVVLVVVGFLLGIGSAATYAVTREEPKPLTAYLLGDSIPAAADSLAGADSAVVVAVLDSVAPVAEALPPVAVAELAPAAGDTLATDSASAPPPVPPAPPAPASTLERERVTRMFAAMKPQEAARVLEQMGDDEVRVLLGALSERKAGAILSSFSPQRAAAISRPSLQTKE